MADYYTHFSFEIPKLHKAEKEWVEAEIKKREQEEDQDGFSRFDAEWAFEDGGLWIHDGSGQANLDYAVLLVQDFIKQFRPTAIFAFEWSNNCSRPRLDAYGGGAVVITARKVHWMNTSTWMRNRIEKIEKSRAVDAKRKKR